MGRHAAPDDAGTDPLVAAALAQQPAGAPVTRHAPRAEGTESGLGWPGDTTTGGGLGWPGSTDTAGDTAPGGPDETARMDAVPPVPAPGDEPGPPGPRGGWRRLFGGRAA
ncbi:hypothetical protein [Geodermatophilus sp. URMC 63]